MEIDWLTVAAQIVNFLVLVWLLQHFLYGPITRAMARREERIEQRLSDARDKRAEAEREAEALREKQEALEARREEMLDDARAEADELRDRLEKKAREEIEESRAAWRETVEREKEEFLRDLRRRAAAQILSITRRTLADFADAELTERLAARFAERLGALDDETREKLAEAARRSEGGAVVDCAHELPPAVRGRVTRAIHERIDGDVEVTYEVDEEMALGLRLTIGAQSVEWSADRHLDRLGDAVREALEGAAAQAAEAA